MTDLTDRPYVLFDFDGTLANTLAAIVRTATACLLEHGLTLEEVGDASRLVGPPFPEAFCQVYGLTGSEAQAVTARYRERYATLGLDAWPLFEGIEDLLDRLGRAGKVLVVASSKLQGVLDRALAEEGIADRFALVVGKPDDRPFTKEQTITRCLALLGCTAEEAVMVGDRHQDVEGSRACGVPCIGVTWGGTGDRRELEGAGACRVVDTVAQLADELIGVTV